MELSNQERQRVEDLYAKIDHRINMVKIAEANLKLAQTNLSRDEKLSQRKLIPQSKLDQTSCNVVYCMLS